MRGFGDSRPTNTPYRAHEDLAALLRYVGVKRACLVGLSLGGRIAIDFAVEHPEMVTALVLASPGLSGFRWSAAGNAWFVPIDSAIAARDSLRAAELWLGSPYMAPAMENPRLAARPRQLARGNAGAGHVLNLEQPERFTRVVLNFLQAEPKSQVGPGRPGRGRV